MLANAPDRAATLPRAADHRGISACLIHELTEAFKRGETTPSKVTDAYLARNRDARRRVAPISR